MYPSTLDVLHIPELVANICSFLQKKDVSPFMRTCRQLYLLCGPFFYKDIDMQDYAVKSLSRSSDSTRALLRNGALVRVIKMDRSFSRSYFNGVGTHYQEACDLMTTLHNWHFPSDGDPHDGDTPVDTDSVAPFPVMTNLRQLQCYASFWGSTSDLNYGIDMGISRLCMLIDLNTHLSDLHLKILRITSGSQVSRLARTISDMKVLGSLTLNIHACGKHTDKIIPALFMSCPQSVHTLDMKLTLFARPSASLRKGVMGAGLEETMVETFPQHLGPLPNLSYWNVQSAASFSMDSLESMLARCPNVNKLEIPELNNTNDVNIAARLILGNCPKLVGLSQQHTFSDTAGELTAAIARAMPEKTLKSIEFSGLDDPYDALLFSLWPHLDSLSSVELLHCVEATSEVFRILFRKCPTLEVLVVGSSEDSEFSIHLEDAVAQTWASNRFTRLELTVLIPELSTKAKVTLLDRFYRQIGALVNLVVLDLRIAVTNAERNVDRDDEEEDVTYKDKLFPGFLKLGDVTESGADRGGYLDLFVGLTRLEKLQGSFNVDPDGEGSIMGQHECEWVCEHWPRLQVADFYPNHFKDGERFDPYSGVKDLEAERLQLPDCFRWLREHMPDLQFMTAL
ncbi:hypothetical protein BGZ95_000389 [Linnemannia exigua]|uniref:F-box domain-containing protein n=1 Tax=Linnemannia exigua TaxID=604196 RepID=A0AAD4DJE8_9FUNG|nr:hypothetical protein BGZ95_000389 [Linnemannia exigua]